MTEYNYSHRYNVKWLSNYEIHSQQLTIEEDTYAIIQAFLIWAPVEEEHEAVLCSATAEHIIPKASIKNIGVSEKKVHFANVTNFVISKPINRYDVFLHLDQSKLDTHWHLIFIYSSPRLPVIHLTVQINHADHNPAYWDRFYSKLPNNYLSIPWETSVDVLDSNLTFHSEQLELQFSDQSIQQTNYHHLQSKALAPLLLIQKINLPETKMLLEHSTDKNYLKVGDIITVHTRITNVGKVTAQPVQYRSTLPEGTTLVPDSFMLNQIPVPMRTDFFNVVGVYLRNMPEGDVITVTYQIQIHTLPTTKQYSSGTVDYNYFPIANQRIVANKCSNIVELKPRNVKIINIKKKGAGSE